MRRSHIRIDMITSNACLPHRFSMCKFCTSSFAHRLHHPDNRIDTPIELRFLRFHVCVHGIVVLGIRVDSVRIIAPYVDFWFKAVLVKALVGAVRKRAISNEWRAVEYFCFAVRTMNHSIFDYSSSSLMLAFTLSSAARMSACPMDSE